MQAKAIIGLIVAIFVSVGVSIFLQDYITAKRDAELAVSRKDTATNTVATVDDGVAADKIAAAVEGVLTDSREQFQQNQQKAKANEPETADRATRPVPRSVRNNFKERRLARERSGYLQSEPAQDDAASDTPQR